MAELDDLKKVNIFVGPNNCGKTSILEAIILSGLFDDLGLLLDALVSRYHGFSMDLLSLFPIDFDDPIICLKSRWNGDEEILHTYHLVECTKEHNVDKCNQCTEFPCGKISSMLERSKEYQKRCKEVCSDAEYDMLEKAFFEKENNLRK